MLTKNCNLFNLKQLKQQYQQQGQDFMDENEMYKEQSEILPKYEMNVQKLPDISDLGFWLSNLGKRNARNLGTEK